MARTSARHRPRLLRGIILQQREDTWPLTHLCRLLPCKPSYKRLWAWVTRGKQHPYDERKRVQMEAVNEADGISSSVEAYRRFIEKLNEA